MLQVKMLAGVTTPYTYVIYSIDIWETNLRESFVKEIPGF